MESAAAVFNFTSGFVLWEAFVVSMIAFQVLRKLGQTPSQQVAAAAWFGVCYTFAAAALSFSLSALPMLVFIAIYLYFLYTLYDVVHEYVKNSVSTFLVVFAAAWISIIQQTAPIAGAAAIFTLMCSASLILATWHISLAALAPTEE